MSKSDDLVERADPQSARIREMSAVAVRPLFGSVGARRGDEPGDDEDCEADECDCDHFWAPSAEPVGLEIPFTDWKSMEVVGTNQ